MSKRHDPAALDEIRKAIRPLLAREELRAFCQVMDDRYVVAGHADLLVEHLEALERRDIQKLMVFMPPRVGKPVSVDARILMGDGSLKRLGDVEIGDSVVGHSGDARRVSAVFEQGQLPGVRITTNAGRSLTAALDHPILTTTGWVHAGDIKPEMAVALMSRQGLGVASAGDAAFRLAGYFVGDGCCVSTGTRGFAARITVDDEIELQDIYRCADELGFTYIVRQQKSRAVEVSLSGGVRQWLTEVGLAHHGSHTKRVPEFVYRGTDNQIAQFIGAYFACDGTASRRGQSRQDGIVEIYSVSRELLSDVQHLLLRLGIMANLSVKNGRYKGERHVSYRLAMRTREDVARFAEAVPVYHRKGERVAGMARGRQTFDALLRPDIVASVELVDAVECRCLTVETDHTFVADDVVVHNSYHVSERFPAWYLGRHPEHNVIVSSHSARLAERASRRIRGLLQSSEYPFPEVTFDPSLKAADRWETTKGGGVLAAGVGTGIVGFGADVLIIDDPVADRQHADSETERNNVWEWYAEAASSRLMPNAVELLMHQRWHEDDLAGRLLNSSAAKEWTVLNLPALAEENDPMGRGVGEAIWPEKFNAAWYTARKELIGPRAFAALYQQRPAAAEGTMFKRAWFKRWDTLPIHQYDDEGRVRSDRWKVFQFIDTAFKTGVGSDYSVIATWATDGIDFYVIDVWRKQVEYPDLKKAIIAAATAHRPRGIFIEDKASGQSVIQELRSQTSLPIIPLKVGGSKESRADAVTAFFEAGKVYVPSNAHWVEDFIDEHIAFPNGAHDDMVDTTAHALKTMAIRGQVSNEPVQLVVNREKRRKQDEGSLHWRMARVR